MVKVWAEWMKNEFKVKLKVIIGTSITIMELNFFYLYVIRDSLQYWRLEITVFITWYRFPDVLRSIYFPTTQYSGEYMYHIDAYIFGNLDMYNRFETVTS